MRIQHNILAMNAYRNYSSNTSALGKNLEKLSSGYKINRAGDDAAGLAISEKMRAQITGLNAAQKNVKDGISLVKTAEGAMQEIQDMLNRMDYLATQSANGTYQDEVDREALQKEVNQLRSEIDRIADSANFNGIKLLDGSQVETKSKTSNAVAAPDPAIDDNVKNIKDTNKVDGTNPTPATKAEVTITLGAAADTITIGDKTGLAPDTMTAGDVLGATVDSVKLGDLFKLQDADGADVASGDALAANKTYKLVAKSSGELKGSLITALNGITANGGSSVTAVNGKNEGAAPDGTKAEYELEFNFKNLAGGQRFQIGTEKFEITTSGTATNGYTAIDLSGIDLTTAGTANTEGQYKAATQIRNALNTKFGTNFDVDAAPDAAPTGDKFTIKMVAKNAETTGGTSANLGDVRVSEAAGDYTGKSAITGKYKPGQVGGSAQEGTYATVTYENFDLSKLAVGDKVTIYGKSIEVVKDAKDADPNAGKLVLDDAKDSAKFIAAFERMFRDAAQGSNKQQNFGKLEINGTTLKVTDAQDVGRKADDLITDVGLTFTPKTAATGTAAQYDTEGGLTLQIGDTSDDYNQLKVIIGDMHVTKMGTTYTVDANGKRVNNVDDNDNVTVIAGKSINDIDISNQKGAADAISVIKDAINYVSSVRGDLGAYQNRLEHTANNLSVMAENIQDAESTIRDTDVAEEMMSYVKNNILVQSAQAMLAQANQVPQGVLQLLG